MWFIVQAKVNQLDKEDEYLQHENIQWDPELDLDKEK